MLMGHPWTFEYFAEEGGLYTGGYSLNTST